MDGSNQGQQPPLSGPQVATSLLAAVMARLCPHCGQLAGTRTSKRVGPHCVRYLRCRTCGWRGKRTVVVLAQRGP